jgi:F-type H+-transporting ATPase subunit epsilon
MQIDIITPDKALFSGNGSSVIVPGIDGILGILENHAPLITALKKGQVKIIDATGAEKHFDINGGVAEVIKNKVIILAE